MLGQTNLIENHIDYIRSEVGYSPGAGNFHQERIFANLPPGHLVIIIGNHTKIEAIYRNVHPMNNQILGKT